MIDFAGGRIFAITRASTTDQVDSPEIQAQIITDFAKQIGLTQEISIMHEPTGTSGVKTEFKNRPIGGWVMRNLRRGDTLIVSKIDRLGRWTRDILHTVEVLFERGVRIVVIDFHGGTPLDLSKPTDKIIITIMAAMAEMRGSLISQNTREAAAYRKRAGFVVAGRHVGFGKKKEYDPTIQRNRVVWDHVTMRRIVEIAGRVCARESLKEITQWIKEKGWVDASGLPLAQRVHAPLVKVKRPYTKLTLMASWLHRTYDAGELPEPYASAVALMPKPPRYRPVRIARRPKVKVEVEPEGDED